MRKYLLSTSTLAGAALLSSVAVADVSISGYMEWEMINGDTDAAATDGTSMAINNEVNIDFTNKTDIEVMRLEIQQEPFGMMWDIIA